MLIEIRNWEKYNPRSDAKAWSWFRFQDNFFEDEDIWELTSAQKLLLVYLFTRKSKAAKPLFRINPRQAAETLRVSGDAVLSDLEAISAAGLITLLPYGHVRTRTDTYGSESVRPDPCPTDGRTDETYLVVDSPSATSTLPVNAPAIPSDLVRVWNEGRSPKQPEVRPKTVKPGSKRHRQAVVRLREEPDLAVWREVVHRLAVSPWHTGENERGWVAGFDFLIKPDTHVRAIEGAFDGRGKQDVTHKTPLF